jgi:RNA polymerase sigma-70 factor (ECF subfamily)
MNHALDQWFAIEILPHEAALMRYLNKVWRSPAEVPDLRQETYVRVFEGAAKSRPHSARSFLFATARNLMIDRMRRDRIVSIDYTHDLNSLEVPVDQLSPERRLGARQELQRLAEAFDRLPEMTRSVIWLRRVEGLSQRQTAEKLGIQESTLEGHMCRGLRMLANILLTKVAASDEQASSNQPDRGSEHGQRTD